MHWVSRTLDRESTRDEQELRVPVHGVSAHESSGRLVLTICYFAATLVVLGLVAALAGVLQNGRDAKAAQRGNDAR